MKNSSMLFAFLISSIIFVATLAYGRNVPTEIRLGYIYGDLHHLPAFVALEKKFFTEQNLQVKVAGVFKAGPEMISAFAADYVDVGYLGGIPAMLAVINKTADIKIVAQVNTNGSAIVVRRDSSIKSVADLQGKRIAIPGYAQMQDYLLRTVLMQHGISVQATNIIIIKPPEMLNALRESQIDAFIAWEPYVSKTVTMGIGKVLIYSSDISKDHVCCILVVNSKFYNKHLDLVIAILKAHIKAIKYINQHPAEAVAIAVKYTGMDEAAIKLALHNIHYTYQLNTQRILKMLNNFENFGYCKACSTASIKENLINTKPLETAIKQ
jgi:NitT/TauT family transport system substrate-binding protein